MEKILNKGKEIVDTKKHKRKSEVKSYINIYININILYGELHQKEQDSGTFVGTPNTNFPIQFIEDMRDK